MKIAIISDIHSNLEAFKSVLKDIKKLSVDKIISLGDNIGYGADPEKVIQTIKKNKIKSILGNHELACLGDDHLLTFNNHAKKALLKNREMLSSSSLTYIVNLDTVMVRYNCRFVHGLPPDSVIKYVKHETKEALIKIIEQMPEQIAFVGHTHCLGLYEYNNGKINIKQLDKNKLSLDKNSSYIVNSGSVGQPRNNSINAEYVIWDSIERTVEPRYVSYNNEKAAKKIRKIGISEIYAQRVEKGKMF